MVTFPYRKVFKNAAIIKVAIIMLIVLTWRYFQVSQVNEDLVEENLKDVFLTANRLADKLSEDAVIFEIDLLLKGRQRSSEYEYPVNTWMESKVTECQGLFHNYDNLFARLAYVIVVPLFASGRRGGELIEDVIGQDEEEEYFQLKDGYFVLNCESPPQNGFSPIMHHQNWTKATVCDSMVDHVFRIKTTTIAIKRYEYVNLYHTMTDFYNAFLITVVFNRKPTDITIVFVDGHPKGSLDSTWGTLFGNVIRAGHLNGSTMFDDMIWSIDGYSSLLNQHGLYHVPYLKQFRTFFLSSHGVSPIHKNLTCSDLNILFVWRRDYVAHPRNPSGMVKRKIANEEEILENVRQRFPNDSVTGVQLDSLSMEQQLKLVIDSDILVGMHGAGLSHTLFLHRRAALVELYPEYWDPDTHHFKAMARWRGLVHKSWQNNDLTYEKENFATYIPIDVIVRLLSEAKRGICNSGTRVNSIGKCVLFMLMYVLIMFL